MNLFPGNGDGTYAASSVIDKASVPIRSIRIADLDGNGSPDILATSGQVSGGSGSIMTLLRQADGTFKNTFTGTVTDSIPVASVLDFDGDSKADLAAVTFDGKLLLYRGNGDGTFGTEVSSTISKNASFLAAGDVNGV